MSLVFQYISLKAVNTAILKNWQLSWDSKPKHIYAYFSKGEGWLLNVELRGEFEGLTFISI